MSFKEIIEKDLSDFNRLTLMLIQGVTRSDVVRAFNGRSPVVGRSVSDYIEELSAEGLIEEKGDFLRYKTSPV